RGSGRSISRSAASATDPTALSSAIPSTWVLRTVATRLITRLATLSRHSVRELLVPSDQSTPLAVSLAIDYRDCAAAVGGRAADAAFGVKPPRKTSRAAAAQLPRAAAPKVLQDFWRAAFGQQAKGFVSSPQPSALVSAGHPRRDPTWESVGSERAHPAAAEPEREVWRA
ncbi:MAG: hypothetical protein ACM3ZE_13515, partial [Myxococcales bacterium]